FCHNRNRSLRSKYIFYEKGCLTHHRSPSGFVPSYTPIGKAYLQLPIIIIVRRNSICQSGPNGRYTNGLGIRHLTHDIDIMHTTVHYRTTPLHRTTMYLPHPSPALLV